MELPLPQPSPPGRGNDAASSARAPSHGGRVAPTTHIIGAGLAGLSAAVRLAEQGRRVAVYEAAGQAGGRCRSYFDAGFGAVIDNGNHLLLSGNDAAIRYLTLIGGADKLCGSAKAEFDFADLATGERWTLKINEGRWPSWLFDPGRRVPGTKPLDYLAAAPLMWAGRRKTVTDIVAGAGPLYERLWQPLMLAALNTDPHEGSARLAGAVMRNTLAKGGAACRPLVAEGLSAAFIDPALAYLGEHGGTVAFGKRLREIEFASGHVRSFKFNDSEFSVRRRRKCYPCCAALGSANACARVDCPDRVPRHTECALQCCATAAISADPWPHSRHSRMDLFISWPFVYHNQRS